MKIKNINLLIIVVFFIFFFVFYIKYNYNNIRTEQSYYYYNMIESLKFNDKRNARFYAKQIVDLSYNTVYSDLALSLIYEELKDKKKDKKIFQFCKKKIKNKKLGLINVVEECNKFLYAKIK